MLEDCDSGVPVRARTSQFASDLAILATRLRHRGHRRSTVVGYMNGAAHLAVCLESGLVQLEGLTADRLQKFARTHINHCSCPRPHAPRTSNFVTVARHFFDVLNERHALTLPMVSMPETSAEALLRRFDEHLRDERGLREATRERRIRELRRVLRDWHGTGMVDVSRWTAHDVRACVVARARLSLRAAKSCGSALRSLFRFLVLRGELVANLAIAVPVAHCARLSGLPQGVSEAQLASLLQSIDVSKPIGLRARAIVELLVGLAFRAGEVADLRLQDIDWRAGVVRINTSKVRRGDVLPLPQRVGRALVAYLKRGRPRTADTHVFVRHFMPVGGRLRSIDVTNTVRRAFRKAGISLPSIGAHVLRHTTAGRLVRAGASIKDIADVMRHRDIDTTRIYTKVDWPRLAEVALPWPTTVAP